MISLDSRASGWARTSRIVSSKSVSMRRCLSANTVAIIQSPSARIVRRCSASSLRSVAASESHAVYRSSPGLGTASDSGFFIFLLGLHPISAYTCSGTHSIVTFRDCAHGLMPQCPDLSAQSVISLASRSAIIIAVRTCVSRARLRSMSPAVELSWATPPSAGPSPRGRQNVKRRSPTVLRRDDFTPFSGRGIERQVVTASAAHIKRLGRNAGSRPTFGI